MRQYRKLHKYAAVAVLVCFFTALTGLSASAGQACCGECARSMPSRPVHAPAMMAADGCGPAGSPLESKCTCTFQSDGDQGQRFTSLTRVRTACGNLQKGRTVEVSTQAVVPDSRQDRIRTTRIQIRACSGPLYLTNQSILC